MSDFEKSNDGYALETEHRVLFATKLYRGKLLMIGKLILILFFLIFFYLKNIPIKDSEEACNKKLNMITDYAKIENKKKTIHKQPAKQPQEEKEQENTEFLIELKDLEISKLGRDLASANETIKTLTKEKYELQEQLDQIKNLREEDKANIGMVLIYSF
jgi:hypothetical protein